MLFFVVVVFLHNLSAFIVYIPLGYVDILALYLNIFVHLYFKIKVF